MAADRSRRHFYKVTLGAPGPYVLGATFATLLWFPARWYDDPHAPPLVVLVRAGLWGVTWWGLFHGLLSCMPERHRTRGDQERARSWGRALEVLRRGEVPVDEWDRAAVVDHLPAVRRGALIGAVGGTVLLGGLTGVALLVDRPMSAAVFGCVLVAVVAVAARTLVRVRRLAGRLADAPVMAVSR